MRFAHFRPSPLPAAQTDFPGMHMFVAGRFDRNIFQFIANPITTKEIKMPNKDGKGPKGQGTKDGHGKGQGKGQGSGQGPMTGGKQGVADKPKKETDTKK